MKDDVGAIKVRDQLDFLAGADVLQLDFLEVGVDMGVHQGDDAHQGGTDLYPLADLGVAGCHHPIHWSADRGSLQIE